MTPIRDAMALCVVLVGSVSLPSADALAAGGLITHLSGNLYARNAEGTLKVLSERSGVEPGDTLVSGKTAYARMQFADGSEIVLGPDSQVRIERFTYDEANPGNDRIELSLIKGGVRSASGLVGKRSPARAQLHTPLGTVSIGSATVILEYAPPTKVAAAVRPVYSFAILAELDPTLARDPGNLTMSDAPRLSVSTQDLMGWQLAQNMPLPSGGNNLAPGLYVHVIDGIINLSNKGGSLSFSAGQFGYTASFVKPPVVLPSNPGMQFTPPPAFSSSTAPGTKSSNNGKSNTVDCEVR